MKVKCHKLFHKGSILTSTTYEIGIKNKDEFIKKIKDSYFLLCEIEIVEPIIEQDDTSITFRRGHMRGNGIMTTYFFTKL